MPIDRWVYLLYNYLTGLSQLLQVSPLPTRPSTQLVGAITKRKTEKPKKTKKKLNDHLSLDLYF